MVNTWIQWAASFLNKWGAQIISAISLFFALLSFFQSTKAQKLQNKINKIEYKLKEYELARIEKTESELNNACVQARIIRMGNDNYRLKVWNSGGKTAFKITAKFEGNPRILIINDEKMPFDELEPMNSFELILVTDLSSECKARVITEWQDASGNAYNKSQMVDI